MKELAIAAAAREDLRDIAQYTEHEWGASQVRRYLGAIRDRLVLLCGRPRLGRPREELAAGLRSLSAGRHIIFYKELEDRIEVLRILHVSMDVRRHLDVAAPPGVPRLTARSKSRKKVSRRRREP